MFIVLLNFPPTKVKPVNSGKDTTRGLSVVSTKVSFRGWQDEAPSFTFKVSDVPYEILKEQPGLRPAP